MEQMDFSIEVSESEIEKFADYLYQKENAKATINKYMADIKKFLSFLADDKRINKKVLLQYKEWLVQKYAVNSVNSMLAALNQFLEFLNVGNLKVKRIKVQKQPFLQDQKEVTEKECRKLIATAMAEGKEQLALCIETIACTGIRISEIKYFTVERVKSGKIEIYNKGKICIGKRVQNRGDLYLICDRGGEMRIGSHVFFNANCSISCMGKVTIGDYCKMGNNLVIVDHDHNYKNTDSEYLTGEYWKPCVDRCELYHT